jgi:hypothetical protein
MAMQAAFLQPPRVQLHCSSSRGTPAAAAASAATAYALENRPFRHLVLATHSQLQQCSPATHVNTFHFCA